MYMVNESEQNGNRISEIQPDNYSDSNVDNEYILFSNGNKFNMDILY